MLEARDVHLRRGGRTALAGVRLGVRPGEMTALVGPNGAGKSSLFAVIAGELRPDRGTATLDGRDLADYPAAALARERAALEQTPSLSAPFRVVDLVALGLEAAPPPDADAAATVARAMAVAGVAGFAARPADRLSGGERARAHLARVLAQLWAGRAAGGGRFLLLDEPTASLDLAHQIAVMEAARAEADAGAGVLVVLHDLNLAAAFADRVVLIADGRIIAQGPPATVFNATLLSDVFRAPISVTRAPDHGLRIAPDLRARAACPAAPPRPAQPAASGDVVELPADA